jgi:glycerol-3-phosphate acyltransferase PlsY
LPILFQKHHVTLAAVLLAYCLGSVSFAILVSRMTRLPDPRSYGSGNPGATNVLRSGRKAAAAATLAGDVFKGWLAVYLARNLVSSADETMLAWVALAVVVGHMYPVFFRFEGGKGVATACGALLALNTYLGAGAFATWLIIVAFFRISSLAAIVAAFFAPFFAFLLYDAAHPYFMSVTAICVMLVWRHRANIRNLLEGKESRIGTSREV